MTRPLLFAGLLAALVLTGLIGMLAASGIVDRLMLALAAAPGALGAWCYAARRLTRRWSGGKASASEPPRDRHPRRGARRKE